jgi:hypothetical protein
MITIEAIGILYLTITRMAITAVGAMCIFLGYRLFLARAGKLESLASASTTASATTADGNKYSFKTAAPGVSFALFGALIIIVMMFVNPPGLDFAFGASRSRQQTGEPSEISRMRGEPLGISEWVLEGKRAERLSDFDEAVRKYETALRLIAEPLNNLAVIHMKNGRKSEARGMAALAIQLVPGEPEFRDTFDQLQAVEP